MNTLLVWKEQIYRLYAKYATYVDKVLKFILGMLVFGMINSNVGFMKIAASIFCTIGLSVICAFLPLFVMLLFASLLILLHFYSLSIAVAGVTAVIFLIMYIFYFRFTPKKAWLVLLTPLAFAFKIPYIIPILFGLGGTASVTLPLVCGTVVYYMLHYVKTSSAALKASDSTGMMESVIAYTKQIFQNKEMFVMCITLLLCLLLVYGIKQSSIDHSWKIAVVAGTVCNVLGIMVGNIVLGTHISYVYLGVGSAVAIFAGVILEFFVFAVDYTRTERMQFEDDEYYYYVKAVPKMVVAMPEKKIQTINERQDTVAINQEDIKKVAEQSKGTAKLNAKKSEIKGQGWSSSQTDQELLKKTLHEEFQMHERKK